mmetsp:Transcript_48812/g.110668  ORF Transcript_48812/g.110668 Transcript_48812/m.110668 type:complete len:324 (-) Transcript_48812:158-1129(-)
MAKQLGLTDLPDDFERFFSELNDEGLRRITVLLEQRKLRSEAEAAAEREIRAALQRLEWATGHTYVCMLHREAGDSTGRTEIRTSAKKVPTRREELPKAAAAASAREPKTGMDHGYSWLVPQMLVLLGITDLLSLAFACRVVKEVVLFPARWGVVGSECQTPGSRSRTVATLARSYDLEAVLLRLRVPALRLDYSLDSCEIPTNQRASSGRSMKPPILDAARLGRLEAVRLLLNAKSQPGATDDAGNTALHEAARYGHETVVRLLLSCKGNPRDRNNFGKTALDWASAEPWEDADLQSRKQRSVRAMETSVVDTLPLGEDGAV